MMLDYDESAPFRLRPLEYRKKKFAEITQNNPDKIPIIFETSPKSKLLKGLNLKFTAKRTMKFSKIIENYRKWAKLESSNSIFFHCQKSKTIQPNASVDEIYEKSKSPEDGFLYIECCEIDAWGSWTLLSEE